jgi:hypothetical protein
MEVGQRIGVIEPFRPGHEALDQTQHTVSPVDEARERPTPVRSVAGSVLIEPGFGAGRVLGRRQEEQSQEVPALVMSAFLLELGAALGIDQSRCGVGEGAFGVSVVRLTLSLDEDRPA